MPEPISTILSMSLAGKTLGSVLIADFAKSCTHSIGYDIGKSQLLKLLDATELGPDGIPRNHHLEAASKASLWGALKFTSIATANAVSNQPTFLEGFLQHWRKGTLLEVGIANVTDTPQSLWLEALDQAIEEERGAFDEQARFEESDATQLLQPGAFDEGLCRFLHQRVADWTQENVRSGERPQEFDDGLANGWSIQGGAQRITFFQAYCLFFREKLKDPTAFNAFAAPVLADLQIKMDELHDKVQGRIAIHFQPLWPYLGDEFAKLHKRFDTIPKEVADELERRELARQPARSQPTIKEPVPDFVGRDEEIERIVNQVEQSGVLIAGVSGQGGIGKTELARAVVSRVKDRYPDGQISIELFGTQEVIKTPERAMEEVLRLLLGPELKLPEDSEQLAKRYQAELASRQVLLLLDNAQNAQQVARLLPPASCGLMVTSRSYFELAGLYPERLEELPQERAEELILEINPAWKELASELATECGRLPQALRVAASAIKRGGLVKPADYLKKFKENRLANLDEVTAALETSYELLRPKDQAFWIRLGVFPDTFDTAAATAVGLGNNDESAGLEILDRLHDASFVRLDVESGRISLHDLAREFALGKLDVDTAFGAGLEHAKHYVNVLVRADTLYLEGNEGVLAGLALYDLEQGNLAATRRWIESRRCESKTVTELAVRLPDAGTYVLFLRLHARERIAWFESAISAAREIGDRCGEGSTLGNFGNAYAALGDARKAIKYYQQTLEVLREIGDRRGEGSTLGNLGSAYKALGDARKAIKYYEQALEIAGKIGDRRGEGNALGNLGLAYEALGEARKAIEYYGQALEIAGKIGDRRGEGSTLGNLGLAYAALGDARKAIKYYQQGLKIAVEIGDRRGEGSTLGNLGLACMDLGDARKAIEYYKQHLKIAVEIGDRRGEGSALGNLGLAYAALGDARKAIKYYQQGLKIVREIGNRRGEANALFNWAVVLATAEDFNAAVPIMQQAAAIYETIESPHAERARRLADEYRQKSDG